MANFSALLGLTLANFHRHPPPLSPLPFASSSKEKVLRDNLVGFTEKIGGGEDKKKKGEEGGEQIGDAKRDLRRVPKKDAIFCVLELKTEEGGEGEEEEEEEEEDKEEEKEEEEEEKELRDMSRLLARLSVVRGMWESTQFHTLMCAKREDAKNNNNNNLF